MVLGALAQPPSHGEPHVIRAFLLQPHVPRVIVGELHDQRPCMFGERGGNLLDELLLPLNVDGCKQLVFMNRLQQFLVFLFALVFSVGERRNVSQLAIELQLVGAALGERQQLL